MLLMRQTDLLLSLSLSGGLAGLDGQGSPGLRLDARPAVGRLLRYLPLRELPRLVHGQTHTAARGANPGPVGGQLIVFVSFVSRPCVTHTDLKITG